MKRKTIRTPYPCDSCRRVAQPAECENKRCSQWQNWFLSRWALIHGYGKKVQGL